ncbi:hypothetical protein SAMN05216537_10383 [Lachnospira multipara]|uniref:Uncharacterized protein n=1 Tax=Lachnospira multipara TaxID=28051 RepID=A0A1H5SQW4_9FIRM|nr:hypothetical protein SAMN05216537_10383 [Lachnospira multipara]
MKKLKLLSNLLWLIGITIIAMVILGKYHFISFLPTSIDPYTSNSSEQLQLASNYTIAFDFTGYAFIIISIVLKIYIMEHTENNIFKTYSLRITENKPNYLLILCKIVIIIFSLICILISSLITLFSFINFDDVPL